MDRREFIEKGSKGLVGFVSAYYGLPSLLSPSTAEAKTSGLEKKLSNDFDFFNKKYRYNVIFESSLPFKKAIAELHIEVEEHGKYNASFVVNPTDPLLSILLNAEYKMETKGKLKGKRLMPDSHSYNLDIRLLRFIPFNIIDNFAKAIFNYKERIIDYTGEINEKNEKGEIIKRERQEKPISLKEYTEDNMPVDILSALFQTWIRYYILMEQNPDLSPGNILELGYLNVVGSGDVAQVKIEVEPQKDGTHKIKAETKDSHLFDLKYPIIIDMYKDMPIKVKVNEAVSGWFKNIIGRLIKPLK